MCLILLYFGPPFFWVPSARREGLALEHLSHETQVKAVMSHEETE